MAADDLEGRTAMTDIRPTQTEIPADAADVPADPAAPPVPPGAFLLELVPVPVTDIDRARAFYADRLGFHVDVDVRPADGVRIVQLTPPGSACSITLAEGVPSLDMPAGTLRGLHLVVSDIEQARAALIERGADVGPVEDLGGVLYAHFADPDGNTWTLQHMPWRV
ncbi:VOC family protein [Planomonospora venezuelensis]|uniref:Catechol 2,3-dioxygenase-like lactoylglutathione lyase family enzyme n=1 Tax=Planomonospora venezuelensis TaxID=1999 RepID=A0A841CYW5_PLAVE|nr:VOC family protein [Planomonospora venezuelensis]MBB5961993.1 catechol 2,3-dioxygenase-like lactoylglutathione lyase family enzyme [Planomonospora venezuelensis]